MGKVKIDKIDITGLLGEKITVCILQLKSPFYDECTIQPVKGFNTLHWNTTELQKRKKKILSLIDQVIDLEHGGIIIVPACSPNTGAFGDASRMCLRRREKSNVARNVFFCNAVSLPKQQIKSSTGKSQIFGHYQGDLPTILDTDVEGGIIASVFGQNILPKLSSISPNNNTVIENPITFRIEETNINCKAVRKIGERIHPNTGRTISYWFCSYISGDAYVKDSKELDAVRWMFPPDVFKYVTSDIFKPVKEYLLNKIEEMNLILKNKKSESIKRLQSLRNIGPVTAERLYSIGIKTPEQMKNSDPEMLHEKLKRESGGTLDKCVLYQLQGAVLDVPWPKCKNLTKGKHKN